MKTQKFTEILISNFTNALKTTHLKHITSKYVFTNL